MPYERNTETRKTTLRTNMDVGDEDAFDLTGPKHLCNRSSLLAAQDKPALMAALVQAVYVAETDRLEGKHGMYALAPKWWNELGYEPVSFIQQEEKSAPIIGAVFRRRAMGHGFEEDVMENYGENEITAPIMVVAFRGTILHLGESMQNDMVANLYVISHKLHTTARFTVALESIRAAIHQVGSENVTIAGHSLGAALTMLAGQILASEGTLVDTHLFNPPFLSPPLERMKSHGWKLALNLAGMASAASLSYLLLDPSSRQAASQAFFALKDWLPHLYINDQDPVCSSYIGYFSSCDFMQKIGAGTLAELVAPFSLRGTLQQYLFGECKAFHLIPCAHLHVVNKNSGKLFKAHKLHQWWSPELKVDYQEINLGVKGHAGCVDIDHST